MLQNTKKMGNKPHHSGHYGGGVDLSKGKTPHDSLMKYMPVDDKGSSILNVGKPYQMGMSMRGPLDKKGPLNKNLVSMKNGETGKAAAKEAARAAAAKGAAEAASEMVTQTQMNRIKNN